ncbi:hypothetical protein QJQ45_030179 [Haematococcus lacustris]|nr:hypothetical protein QJQ45_030179 [Haematococcus lacustris]
MTAALGASAATLGFKAEMRSHPSMQSLLPARACSARTGLRIGWGSRPAGVTRSPAPHNCILPWLPSGPSRKLSVPAQGVQYSLLPPTAASTHRCHWIVQAKLDLEQLVAMVEKLPVQLSSTQGEQLVQLVQGMAEWDRLDEGSRSQMTEALLQCLGVGDEAESAHQLSIAAWSLVMLKRHLPPPAATSAFSAFIRHCVSSEAMKRGSWRDWSKLLDALEKAVMTCSKCPDVIRLCDQAVQLLHTELPRGQAYRYISMILCAMVSVGYRGSAQPLLQAVTAAISQGLFMVNARFPRWGKLIMAARELHGCRLELRQLLELFAAKASNTINDLNGRPVSTIIYAMRLALWRDIEFCRQLAERVARVGMNSRQLANSLHSLACLGYLDSSVHDLSTKVADADLSAFGAGDLTNLLHARSMFLALSIHQAVSSGHSQLASEPQLNSMAAALWRECSRRGPDHEQWRANHLNQLCAASQWLHACTGGQTPLAESPALLELVAKAITCQTSSTESAHTADGCVDYSQLVQALAAAGDNEVEQAALSLDGTLRSQLVVKGPGLTRGIAVYQSHAFLHDGSMSGAVAYVKLQQLAHFDAGVVVNKAVFDQLASDSERAAFMREQVRASLPEAEAWRKVLQMLKEASVGDGTLELDSRWLRAVPAEGIAMVPTYKPGHTVTATGFRTAGSLAIDHCGSQTKGSMPQTSTRLLPILRSLNRLNLLCQSRAIFVEDLMQEVALTANKITAMYSGPSPFSALDFPELTAFTNVAGPGSCLVYNGSGHLALQPHGSGSTTVQSDEADSDSEDEEVVGSRQAAADMETTFGENEEEEEGSELGSEPVQLYAWTRPSLTANWRQPSEHRVELSSSAANPAKETTKLWRYLAGQPITKADILEYIKLAELALVMTPGSVEEERMFSAMAYLKDDTRNRLQECHLNVLADDAAMKDAVLHLAGLSYTAHEHPGVCRISLLSCTSDTKLPPGTLTADGYVRRLEAACQLLHEGLKPPQAKAAQPSSSGYAAHNATPSASPTPLTAASTSAGKLCTLLLTDQEVLDVVLALHDVRTAQLCHLMPWSGSHVLKLPPPSEALAQQLSQSQRSVPGSQLLAFITALEDDNSLEGDPLLDVWDSMHRAILLVLAALQSLPIRPHPQHPEPTATTHSSTTTQVPAGYHRCSACLLLSLRLAICLAEHCVEQPLGKDLTLARLHATLPVLLLGLSPAIMVMQAAGHPEAQAQCVQFVRCLLRLETESARNLIKTTPKASSDSSSRPHGSSRGRASSRGPRGDTGRSGASQSAGDKLNALAINSYLAQVLCDVVGRQEEAFALKMIMSTCPGEGPGRIEGLMHDVISFGGMALTVASQHFVPLQQTLKEAARATSHTNARVASSRQSAAVPDILSLLARFLPEFQAALVALKISAAISNVNESIAIEIETLEFCLTYLPTMYKALYKAVVNLTGLLPDWRRRPAVLRTGLRIAAAGSLAHPTMVSLLPSLEHVDRTPHATSAPCLLPATVQRLPELAEKLSNMSLHATHLWSLVLAQDGVNEPTGPFRLDYGFHYRLTTDRVAVRPSPSSPQLEPSALDLVQGMENTLQMVMQHQDMVWKWPLWNEGNLVQSLVDGYRTLLALFGHVIEVLAAPSLVGPAGLAAQPASWLPCGNSPVEGWCTRLLAGVCKLMYIATPASATVPYLFKIMLNRRLRGSYMLLLRGQRQAPASMSPEAERLLSCLTLVLTAMVPMELCLALAQGVTNTVPGLDMMMEQERRAMGFALCKLQPEQVWTWQELAAGTPAEAALQGLLSAMASLFQMQGLVTPIAPGWRHQRLTVALGQWHES